MRGGEGCRTEEPMGSSQTTATYVRDGRERNLRAAGKVGGHELDHFQHFARDASSRIRVIFVT